MLVYMLPFCNSDTPVMNRYSLISIRELAMWTTKLVSIIGRRLNGIYEAEKFTFLEVNSETRQLHKRRKQEFQVSRLVQVMAMFSFLSKEV